MSLRTYFTAAERHKRDSLHVKLVFSGAAVGTIVGAVLDENRIAGAHLGFVAGGIVTGLVNNFRDSVTARYVRWLLDREQASVAESFEP